MLRLWLFGYCFLIFIAPVFVGIAMATFADCKRSIEADLNSTNTSIREAAEAILWPHDRPLAHFRLGNDKRPIVVTKAGCEQRCGTSPEIRHTFDAFQIVTTWVLPVFALCAQFPYESRSQKR